MEKNGKFFIAPPKDGRDFKELFKHLAAAGAGRPLDSDGFPSGPWTPELLSDAISQIDSNRVGVDLRSVQLWFQENDKGVSAANIRWLARIFGCDDPVETSEWQMELSAARSRLAAKRRDSRRAETPRNRIPDLPLADADTNTIVYTAQGEAPGQKQGFSLGRLSETVFTHGSPLNLPASVFAGASALGFLAYILGIHSAIYTRVDGVVKQVGFLWSPNWTFLFMVLLPVFFVLVTELLFYWKSTGRMTLAGHGDKIQSSLDWNRHLKAYSYSYWAVFVICIPFAGIFQWIAVDLIPLLKGGGDYAISWSTLAIIRPEVVSVPMSIVFSGLAYLYMCLCFYLLFAGLILLHTILHDLWTIERATQLRPDEFQREAGAIALRVMEGIFRCTTVGIMVAICMKLQSAYLASNGKDIVTWIVNDISVVFDGYANGRNGFHYRMPTHFSSLLVAISSCVGFLFGSVRFARRFHMPLWRMSAVVALLFATYMLIDAFDGFSILLGIATLLATYALFDPEFGRWRADETESDQRVS
ncbi:RcgA family putative transporter [Rhizobium sp. PP-CC-3G-465]|uniref:RcgA family putative transporter n=1 Tax=Rhizobium sp. PP-CC-3G-465 TaxID=2135648 RepID=UPI00104A2049